MSSQPGPACPLDEVIVPPERAPERKTAAHTDALLSLSHTLAQDPQNALHRLVETAMQLTRAQSAGLSIVDSEAGVPVFRWIATAGEFAPYANGTMPRHFSPCGEVLARGRSLVMRRPARHYGYIGQIPVPVESVLLAPFHRAGKPVGTVWVVSHKATRSFTDRDVASVQDLTTFATAILDARERRR